MTSSTNDIGLQRSLSVLFLLLANKYVALKIYTRFDGENGDAKDAVKAGFGPAKKTNKKGAGLQNM